MLQFTDRRPLTPLERRLVAYIASMSGAVVPETAARDVGTDVATLLRMLVDLDGWHIVQRRPDFDQPAIDLATVSEWSARHASVGVVVTPYGQVMAAPHGDGKRWTAQRRRT